MRLTFKRAGIAAVAVAAVLALSSCSGGGDSAEKQPTTGGSTAGRSASPSASTSTVAAPTDSASGPPESAAAGGDPTQTVGGVWLATQDTTKIQLVLGKGKAALTSTHLCGGGYTDQDGIEITMTCMDGDKERTNGRGVLAADGRTLTVQWSDGPTDVFSRTGLPSS